MAKGPNKTAPARVAQAPAAKAAGGEVPAAGDTNHTAPGAVVAAPPAEQSAGAEAGDKPKAENITVTHLQVASRKAGFRRAGRSWPAEAVTVAIDDFTADQVEQLMAEPMLTVLPIAADEKK